MPKSVDPSVARVHCCLVEVATRKARSQIFWLSSTSCFIFRLSQLLFDQHVNVLSLEVKLAFSPVEAFAAGSEEAPTLWRGGE